MMRWLFPFLMLSLCAGIADGAVLEGVGHASIRDQNLDQARAEARQAAMRDLALQYQARVSTRDTMENGELVGSHTELSALAQVRNATIVDEYQSGNLLRVIVRAEMSDAGGEAGSCQSAEASTLRKRVAVTAFPVIRPEQGGDGLDEAGLQLSQALVARLQQQERLQVLGATSLQLFSNLPDAPTSRKNSATNQLTNVVQLARELGAQFVVSGVIRDIGLADPGAWGSSILDRMQRSIGLTDTSRRFEAELMVFDGFSGSPVFRQRFETSADWRPDGSGSGSFAGAGFGDSEWGSAVEGVMADMTAAVTRALACQPFMARITRVDGQRVTLASGATAGLRPGDELHLYRSQRYFDSLDGTPELSDTGVTLTLDNVHPDFSNGQMPEEGGLINVQRDDLAIIW
ncbi:flagella assembly protein FlgT [Marinobacter daepoensis]|uniref:Flagella assembly protein FlgT n=1 Tax=Marinobacter daepoensis TaxID=262077 RepID=A0ABS3BG34_9GAMM|nr:flagellar assembly protein T N-terminal domain-containing protein [Marinobacter daepoensis]MBN7770790.1 flagella assembly protein FlgT [Marinobacter daepoensis]MBY6078651.1 flagella assembly protein FlgT [Marinobacter daepoensis]